MSTGLQEKGKQIEKSERSNSVSKAAIFDHIRESCVNDTFYLTRVMVSAVGKHAGMLILRLAVYVLVVYPFFTEILGLSRGASGVCVLLCIVAYYSVRSIFDRLKDEVKDGSG